jgi:uncharacterized membrane protein YphA (DoxX/SURF4 family)
MGIDMTSSVQHQSTGFIARRVVPVIARMLGSVFVLSGIAKIPLFKSFIETIILITKSSPTFSTVLATLVVVFEIGGGIALVMQYRIVLASTLFSLLVGLFILVQVDALIQQKNFLCHCFGIVDVGLTRFGEIVLDVILLNAFIGLALLQRKERYSLGFRGIMLLGLFVFGEYSVVSPLQRFSNLTVQTDIVLTDSFVEHRVPEFASFGKGKRVVFLLSYADFSCPPCFDSFAALADSLKLLMVGRDRYRVAGIFREDEIMSSNDQKRLTHWKEVNGFEFPVIVAPDSVFQRMNAGKSAVLVSEADNGIFFAPFPLSSQQFRTVLSIVK